MFETVRAFVDSKKQLHLKKNNYIRAELKNILSKESEDRKFIVKDYCDNIITHKQDVITLLAGWEEEKKISTPSQAYFDYDPNKKNKRGSNSDIISTTDLYEED